MARVYPLEESAYGDYVASAAGQTSEVLQLPPNGGSVRCVGSLRGRHDLRQ
jgi:hypothetical protein